MAAAAGSSDGVVKHLLLARFKEEVTTERLDGLIRRYAALVDTVPSMKAFHWYAHPSLILASSHTCLPPAAHGRCSTNSVPGLILGCESRILICMWPLVWNPYA
jgi:hypothetical protein